MQLTHLDPSVSPCYVTRIGNANNGLAFYMFTAEKGSTTQEFTYLHIPSHTFDVVHIDTSC